MPQLPDPKSEPIADLPNPELNPLLNPVLGRHLGRWAHVYFTTAPEKRDEALYDLLAELKAEEGSGTSPNQAVEDVDENLPAYSVVCPRCERTNVRPQKFCGMCGAQMPLVSAAAASTGASLVRTEPSPAPATFASEARQDSYTEVEEEEVGQDDRWSNYSSGPTSLLFQSSGLEAEKKDSHATRETSGADPGDAPVDVDWLRERNLLSSYSEERSSSKFLAVALLIAVAAAGSWLYLRVRATRQTTVVTAPRSQQSSSSSGSITPAPSDESSSNTNSADATPAPTQPQGQAEQASVPQNSRAAPAVPLEKPAKPASPRIEPSAARQPATTPAISRTPAESPAATSTPTEGGFAELALARKQLAQNNPEVAVPLLWNALGKNNSQAAILLSDLYMHGQGVAKNCEQARVILETASRKGIAEARQHLESLGTCHN